MNSKNFKKRNSIQGNTSKQLHKIMDFEITRKNALITIMNKNDSHADSIIKFSKILELHFHEEIFIISAIDNYTLGVLSYFELSQMIEIEVWMIYKSKSKFLTIVGFKQSRHNLVSFYFMLSMITILFAYIHILMQIGQGDFHLEFM